MSDPVSCAMTDRLVATLCFGLAYLSGVAALLILFVGFIDWLQTGRWNVLSVLELGYNTHVIKAHWFLNHRWSWWIHDVLAQIPLYAALLLLAPSAWVFGAWVARR